MVVDLMEVEEAAATHQAGEAAAARRQVVMVDFAAAGSTQVL